MNGNVEAIKWFIANGVSVDAKGSDGKTALHHAVIKLRSEAVAILLKLGANIQIEYKDSKTAKDHASSEILKLFPQ